MTRTAPRQPSLPLWPGPDDWRLDPDTRAVGRRGLAEARAALAAATRRGEARFPAPGARRAA